MNKSVDVEYLDMAVPPPKPPTARPAPVPPVPVAPPPLAQEQPLTMKSTQKTPAQQMAERVAADLKAGSVVQEKNQLPIADELSTRDLSAYSSSSNTRQKIMKALVEMGVVQQQGPRKPALVSAEYRAAGAVDSGRLNEVASALENLGLGKAEAKEYAAVSGGDSVDKHISNAPKMVGQK